MKVMISEFSDAYDVYNKNLKDSELKFDDIMIEVEKYVLETQESFQGNSAEALRENIQTRFRSLYTTYVDINDLMVKAVSDIAETGIDLFGEDGVVDTDELEEVKVEMLKSANNRIRVLEEINSILSSLDDIIDIETESTHDVEEIQDAYIRCCDDFINTTYEFNKYIEDKMQAVNDLLSQTSNEFGFTLPFNHTMRGARVDETLTSEDIFINNMSKMYGFNREESKILFKLWESIVMQFPNEDNQYHAWVFTRTIAYLGSYNSGVWDKTAGGLPTMFGDTIEAYDQNGNVIFINIYSNESVFSGLKELGLTEDEIKTIYIAVDRQHLMSSLGDEEFYDDSGVNIDNEVLDNTSAKYKLLYNDPNMSEDDLEQMILDDYDRFRGKGDFAHLNATLSTGFNENSNFLADVATGNKTFISSGFYGDITDIGSAPNLGNDDYIADLDSDNIYNRYKDNDSKSFIDVTNNYYSDVTNGSTSRSAEFLGNHGGIEGITKEIYGDDMDPGNESFLFGLDFDFDDVDSQAAKTESKKFLEALKGGFDTLTEYEESKKE